MAELDALAAALAAGRTFDLGQPLTRDAPFHPNYPPFTMTLQYRHGDWHAPCGMTFASELIFMTGHTGTHVDALGHCIRAADGDGPGADHAGLRGGSVDELPPLVGRGVLLDAAGHAGMSALEDGEALGGAELEAIAAGQGTDVRPGDAVLIRTGRGAAWAEPARYFDPAGASPGPDAGGCAWLAERGVALAGSDTLTFERIDAALDGFGEGHLALLGAGIPIVECLALEELAAAGAHEFLFVLTPLRIVGGTGSPVRPLAIVPA